MRDFNFFEPYIKVTTQPNRKRVFGIVLVALVLVLMVFYQLLLSNQIAEAKSELAVLDQFINSNETRDALEVIASKEALESDLRATNDALVQIDNELLLTHAVSDDLVQSINAQVPEESFLTEIMLSNGRLNIRGYSTNYENIAQIAYNLRGTPNFTDVQIPNVTEMDAQYQFSITAEWLKEGANAINE